MQKEFNDTGLCIPHRHYMVNNSDKLKQIIILVEKGKYFTINRPRQFGKTTTMFLLDKALNLRDDYVAVKLSFEGIDSDTHQHRERFIAEILIMIAHRLEFLGWPNLSQLVEKHRPEITNLPALSRFITKLIGTMPTKLWVLMIDEVDKSSNNQLFLDFLGMLRNKYLHRDDGEETFQSIILAGVHDIKTLKQKIRPGQDSGYNSPWNIAIDFEVDLSFAAHEIETMVQDYSQDKGIEPNIPAIAKQLYYYTSGYPYLVSKLCKFIDEKIIPRRDDKNWLVDDVESAFKMIVAEGYTTTLFDSLTKNLENNQDLYNNVFNLVINGQRIPFNITVPVINLGYLYGIFKDSDEGC
ncbi:MAG: AAA family ATPase, partial [candidate division Zixibacteria bacterium]|nr:AAA family ATPase [candidate division Zixibacteria bacterium]